MKHRSTHTAALLLAGILLLTLLSACDDEPPTQSQPPANVIVPLAVGNTWWGTYTYYDSLGNEVFSRGTKTAVLDPAVLRWQVWYGWEIDDGLHGPNELVRNFADGFYQYATDSLGMPAPIHILKYPADSGDTFNRDGRTVTVISTHDTVTVPAGQFVCYVYESEGFTQYVQPNTGLVIVEILGEIAINNAMAARTVYVLDS
ncbi:MAG: hypothetical protein KKA42_00830, partial [candidate division Zixibacteria bacterium]|nr:hypothetical protein [candidate division Zixibacteria bacterium]